MCHATLRPCGTRPVYIFYRVANSRRHFLEKDSIDSTEIQCGVQYTPLYIGFGGIIYLVITTHKIVAFNIILIIIITS